MHLFIVLIFNFNFTLRPMLSAAVFTWRVEDVTGILVHQ